MSAATKACAEQIRALAKQAGEGGALAMAQALTGLAASVDRGRLTPTEAAAKLEEQAAITALRAKALSALTDGINAAAEACRTAGAS